MNTLLRIWPYVYPSRRRLYVSFAFAALVALFWGLNLSIVYPVVEVLFQGENLQSTVEKKIGAAQSEVQDYQNAVADFIEKLKTANEQEQVHLLQKKARAEFKLTEATRRLAWSQWVLVYVLPWFPTDRFDTFAVILGFLMVATVIKLACMLVEETLVGSVVQLTIMRIRKECFRRALGLDYQALIRRGTPELMSRFTYDIETLGNGLSLLGGKLVREPLKAVACVTFAFWVNWRLSLLSVLFVPLALLIFNRIGKRLKKASHRSMESMSRIYQVLEEAFDSLKIVIPFDGGRRHRQRHHRENKTYYEKSMSIVFIDALTGPVTELLGLAAVLVAMLPGAYLVLRGTISIWGIRLAPTAVGIAELAVLYTLLAGVIDPVRKLSSIFSKLKKATAAAERVFELMDAPRRVVDPAQPRVLPERIQGIEFQNVVFRYDSDRKGRPAALDSVSLKVAAGEVLAVVGENGSGKSTLVNLLPRYFDPEQGAVLVDGIDLRQCRLKDLRGRIGIVTQETLLFDDTIHENIRYGRPGATRAEVELAAERAHVLPFIGELPHGFQTQIGAKGAALSGGQRQRISLARAILRDPSILILDEATSAIDAQSEYLIHQTLTQFVRGRTTFIITHAVTQGVLELVTRIVVMDRGRLLMVGTHDELLAQCPAYERLYSIQARPARSVEPGAGELAA